MATCQRCGRVWPDDFLVCPKDGAQLRASQPTELNEKTDLDIGMRGHGTKESITDPAQLGHTAASTAPLPAQSSTTTTGGFGEDTHTSKTVALGQINTQSLPAPSSNTQDPLIGKVVGEFVV